MSLIPVASPAPFKEAAHLTQGPGYSVNTPAASCFPLTYLPSWTSSKWGNGPEPRCSFVLCPMGWTTFHLYVILVLKLATPLIEIQCQSVDTGYTHLPYTLGECIFCSQRLWALRGLLFCFVFFFLFIERPRCYCSFCRKVNREFLFRCIVSGQVLYCGSKPMSTSLVENLLKWRVSPQFFMFTYLFFFPQFASQF